MKRFSRPGALLASILFCAASLGVLQTVAQTVAQAAANESSFVRLTPLPPPQIVSSAEEYPGGSCKAAYLIDGTTDTAFASNSKGIHTFVEFDFGKPVNVGAFRHVDRNDPATVAESELIFFDAAGKPLPAIPVQHAGKRAGATMFMLPQPVMARRVRWQVTKLTDERCQCVGGAEIVFYEAQAESTPQGIGIETLGEMAVERNEGRLLQPVEVSLNSPYAAPVDAIVRVETQEPRPVRLAFGSQAVRFAIPAVETQRTLQVAVDFAGKTVAAGDVTAKPVRKFVVYLLPHSHIDIGYTHLQTDVEKLQMRNIDVALELCRKTADYPPEARFKWNVEVLWAVDHYLHKASPEKQQRLIDAIRAGQIGLDALYCNELTGLCRPEELLRLLDCARQLSKRCGVTIDSAMISDVPGYTWGAVPALSLAGVKYFSLGINYADGARAMAAWEDKPFYWLGPDGRQKILCWVPYKGYALAYPNVQFKLDRDLPKRLAQLEQMGYPYDIVYLRWSVTDDNGPPDAALPDLVKRWNATHTYPQMVIATTGEMFHEFEKRYSDKIPVVSGDFTPYWESGACSTARETAINRTAAERLVQAEILSAMFDPQQYAAERFDEAWRNVILYDEHTWALGTALTNRTIRSSSANGRSSRRLLWTATPNRANCWLPRWPLAVANPRPARSMCSTRLLGREPISSCSTRN